MASLNEVLEGKSICICAGSGGVGKTTTSAAIATGMAAQGLKVCVLTIDPAKRLADSHGLKELGNEARRVDPGLFEKQGVEMKGELWAMMLDAKATFDDLVARQAPDEESRDRVLENRIYLNGLYPERFKKEEAEKLSALAGSENGASRAAARAALSEFGRARSQRQQLARLKRGVEAPVKTLPFLFEPELDVEAARRLSRKLS